MFKIHQQNIETIPNQLTIELCPTYPEQYHPVKGNVLMDHSWKTKVITIILIFLFKCMKNWLAESSPIYSRNGIFLIFMLMQKTFYTKVRGDKTLHTHTDTHSGWTWKISYILFEKVPFIKIRLFLLCINILLWFHKLFSYVNSNFRRLNFKQLPFFRHYALISLNCLYSSGIRCH